MARSTARDRQSADFYEDGTFAGMTLREQAEASSMSSAGVRRLRRLEQNRRNISEVATDQSLTDYINNTVNAAHVTGPSGNTGGRVASYNQQKQGAQHDAVAKAAEAAGVPLQYMEGKDVYALNTGFGASGATDLYNSGYEYAGAKAAPGEYTRFKEQPKGNWYDPGNIIKMAVTTAIGAGVGGAFAGGATALGAGSSAAGVAGGVGSGLGSGYVAGARGTDLLKAGAIGAVSPLLSKVPGLRDPNLVSSFGRGTLTDVISQGVSDGKIDFGKALKSGALGTAMDVGKDLLGDAKQTNDGNLKEGVDTIDNGRTMSPDDITRLTNTSDLYGLLGDKGLLSKIGIDLSGDNGGLFSENGYLNTDYIGGGLDFLGLGDRPMENNPTELAKKAQAEINAIESEGLSVAETGAKIKAIEDQFFADTARYDERGLKFLERGNSKRTGIYEFENEGPTAGTGFMDTLKNAVGAGDYASGDLASIAPGVDIQDPTFTPEDDPAFREYMSRNPTASIDTSNTEITDSIFPEIAPPQESTPVYSPDEQEDYVPAAELDGSQEFTPEEYPPEDYQPAAEEVDDYVPAEYQKEFVDIETDAGGGGGGGYPAGGDIGLPTGRPYSKEDDEELFRLASILKIEGVPKDMATAALTRMKGLLSRKEQSRVQGDVTALRDEESSRYIQRYKGDTKKAVRAAAAPDPVQDAINGALAG